MSGYTPINFLSFYNLKICFLDKELYTYESKWIYGSFVSLHLRSELNVEL
jgi:hypothetical protein